ncbi:16S rRNA (uracil(1498)-N(3))-methyltransferase [Sporichthya sp.]|uniref:16S rRNA (uracil(1498)-N(3))-methyltransferase n=1 Tax=Sporichthya sp. TaxID=65475 RepID=UPI0017BBA01B|nr:16S rRNA (uracil(1498)-N(3))-methyltransferase [Sporichthya sp.]MBA3745588.1 16S rRNA (uracil(1498)-N(3))-methyltransferase [Sporichthya sp.]
MTAPLFFVEAGALGSDEIVLDGAEGRHAAKVRRLRAGEQVDLADGTGALAHCLVTLAGVDALTLTVQERTTAPAPTPSFTVVQALPKGDRGELAVEVLTEVGVDEIVPWQAARCVTKWTGDRGERSAQRWAAHAREAAKQARRARVPTLAPAASTAEVSARLSAAALAIVLHEGASDPLATVMLPSSGEVVLVVGPEGGVDESELAAFAAAGALTSRLGPEVLRTSTAGVAALAALLARTSRWA